MTRKIIETDIRSEIRQICPENYGFEVLGEGRWRKELQGESMEFSLISWHDHEALEQIVDLQQEAWGLGDRDLVPGNILAIAEDTGGSIIAAKNETNGMLEGFVLTLGRTDGSLLLHMIATSSDQKYVRNIGWNLAVLQAAEAVDSGVSKIEWTYDPLIGGNAKLYLEKLGARAHKYTINKYGQVLGIYGEDPTDRLTVVWDLEDPTVAERLGAVYMGSYRSTSLEDVEGLPVYEEGISVDCEEFLVEIPGLDPDRVDPEEKVWWRMGLRSALSGQLDTENERGFVNGHMEIVGLASGYVGGQRKNYYVVERRKS